MTNKMEFSLGTRVRIQKGCMGEGKKGMVIATPVDLGQPWVGIRWDDDDDPDWFKASCLEPIPELDLDNLLNIKETARLVWEEPHPGVDSAGNETDAHVRLSALVKDCISMERGRILSKNFGLSDHDLLEKFIAVNGAWVDGQ